MAKPCVTNRQKTVFTAVDPHKLALFLPMMFGVIEFTRKGSLFGFPKAQVQHPWQRKL